MQWLLSAIFLIGQIIDEIVADNAWSTHIPYISLSQLQNHTYYDFIVIGAGASGSVLATRLALHPTYPKVLLLEAGNKANTSASSCEMLPPISFNCQLTEIDWSYKTIPEQNCCSGSINQQVLIPRGKVMGGSTVLNTMFWVYGHPQDWDKIMKINGWKSKDVLPYFHKIENYHPYPYNKNTDSRAKNRGQNGPIELNEARNLLDEDTSTLATKFIESCVKSGYEFIDDINDWETNGNKFGCHYAQNNIEYESGLRINAFVGYMKYLLNTKAFKQGKVNLDILSNAHVTRINFDGKKSKGGKHTASGVVFTYQDGKSYHVRLKSEEKGEIIVSGGTFGSPHLLMLSGIGPADELIKHNISVIEDIKGVGQNLQDHVFVPTRFFLKEEYFGKTVTANTFNNNLRTSLLEANAFISTEGGTSPDIKYHFFRGSWIDPKYFNFREDDEMNLMKCGDEKYYSDLNNIEAFMVTTILEHPKSRGEITLKSSNPFVYPNIEAKYLSEKYDIDTLKNGYKFLLKLMDGIKGDVWDVRAKCDNFGDIDKDDRALEEFLRASAIQQFHQVGTCKMGNDINDDMVVVNTKLKLKNVRNVRVADASILDLLTGNIQAACYMIGERAAEFILNEWGKQIKTEL